MSTVYSLNMTYCPKTMLGTEDRVVDRYATQIPDGVHLHILNVICMDDAIQNT